VRIDELRLGLDALDRLTQRAMQRMGIMHPARWPGAQHRIGDQNGGMARRADAGQHLP
jgi:hypothetical protein